MSGQGTGGGGPIIIGHAAKEHHLQPNHPLYQKFKDLLKELDEVVEEMEEVVEDDEASE